MFEEMSVSSFLIITLILFLLSLIYLQYLKLYSISIIRNQCQLTQEKLNKIYLSTDILDQEYYQLKQILSSSSNNDIGQRLGNIENEQRRSLIDQQRIQTLEHLNRQLKNDLNTSKLVNESLRKRLNSIPQMNNEYIIPKIRNNRLYPPSRKVWPFPCLPPWIRPRLPSVPEDKIYENSNSHSSFPLSLDQSNGLYSSSSI